MKRIFAFIVTGIFIMGFIACGNSKTPDYSGSKPDMPGENVGLVLPWVIDEKNEAERGTVAFAIYDDNGTYYIEFHNKGYRLNRITPMDVGSGVLYYKFTTDWGGTYYLEDVSDPSCRILNN